MRSGIRLGFALFALVACGGDDDSSPGVNTGLPPDSTLASLSSSDVQKLCTSWVNAINAAIPPSALTRLECVSLAAAVSVTSGSNGTTSVDVNACNQQVTQCEQQAAAQPSASEASAGSSIVDVDCTASDVTTSIARCHAAVKDFEQCSGALLATLKQQLDQLQCANLAALSNNGEVDPGTVDIASIPDCASLQSACPNLELSGASSDSSTP